MKCMNIAWIAFLVVTLAFFSWGISSYFVLHYVWGEKFTKSAIQSEKNREGDSALPKEITKETKIIEVKNVESEVIRLIKNVSPSVVNIIITKDIDLYRQDPWGFFQERIWRVERRVGAWAGFFITKDGLILTNKHVVHDKDAKYTVITHAWKEYSASVVAFDPLTDLAVIRIENVQNETFPVLSVIEDETYIDIWQFVIAIGNPLGEFQNSVSFGIVSGKNRSIEASVDFYKTEKLTGLLQTDAAINPGNSGGPLINLQGEVIGINTAIVGNSQNLWFSIPLSKKRIAYILSSIKKYNAIKRPFVGIVYVPLTPSIAQEKNLPVEYGAYIPSSENIIPWSSAQKIWLEAGDIILSIDGVKVTLENPIQSIIQNKIPGEVITLEVLKSNGKKVFLELELWEY